MKISITKLPLLLIPVLFCGIASARLISTVMGGQSDGFDPWNQTRWSQWYLDGNLVEPFEIDVSVTFAPRGEPWRVDMSYMRTMPGAFPSLFVFNTNSSLVFDGGGVEIDARKSYVYSWSLYYLYTNTININEDYVNCDGIFLYQTEAAADSGSVVSNLVLKGFNRAIASHHFHCRKVTIDNVALVRNIWGLFPRGCNVTVRNSVISENVLGGFYGEYNSYNWIFTGSTFKDNNNRGTNSYGDAVLDACRNYIISGNSFLGASYNTRDYRTAVSLYRNAGEQNDIRELAAKDNLISDNIFEGYNIAVDFAPRMGLINSIEQSGEARCYTSGNIVENCSFTDCVIGIVLRGSGAVIRGNSFALCNPAYAYEPFDYQSGSITGQNGGSGWSSPWRFDYTQGSEEITEQGLTFCDIAVSGKALKLTEDNTAGSFRSVGVRRLAGFEPAVGSDLWISFLAKSDGVLTSFTSKTAEIRHGATPGATKLRMRPKGSGSQGVVIAYDSTGTNSASKSTQDGRTYLYLCRFGNVGQASGKYAVMWVFDEDGYNAAANNGGLTEENLNTYCYLMAQDEHVNATLNINDGVLVNIGDSSADVFSYYFDELRYGSTLDDVVADKCVQIPIAMHNVFYSMHSNTINQPHTNVWLWSAANDYAAFADYLAYNSFVGGGITSQEKFYHIISDWPYPVFNNPSNAHLLVGASVLVPDAPDINSDMLTDIDDLRIIAADWLTEGGVQQHTMQNTNIDGIGVVDMKDAALCAQRWTKDGDRTDFYGVQERPTDIAVGDMAVYEPGDEIAVIWDNPVSNINGVDYYSIVIYNSAGLELDRCARSETKWAVIAAGNFLPDTGHIREDANYEIAAAAADADENGKYPVYIFRKGFKEPAVVLYQDNTSPVCAIASGNFRTSYDGYDEIAVNVCGGNNIVYLKPSDPSWTGYTYNTATNITDMAAADYDGIADNGDEIAAITDTPGPVLLYRYGGNANYASAADNQKRWAAVAGGDFDGGARARDEIAVADSQLSDGLYKISYYAAQNNTPLKQTLTDIAYSMPVALERGRFAIEQPLTLYDRLVNISSAQFFETSGAWGDYIVVLPSQCRKYNIPVFSLITNPADSSQSHCRTVPVMK